MCVAFCPAPFALLRHRMALTASTYTERKVPAMKIVVLRSPAIIAPILRRMFGIRKEKRR